VNRRAQRPLRPDLGHQGRQRRRILPGRHSPGRHGRNRAPWEPGAAGSSGYSTATDAFTPCRRGSRRGGRLGQGLGPRAGTHTRILGNAKAVYDGVQPRWNLMASVSTAARCGSGRLRRRCLRGQFPTIDSDRR
jgi:hypothetical protein